jgi:hypothetical protein
MFCLQHLFFHVYSCFLENSLWCDYYIGSLHCRVYTACEEKFYRIIPYRSTSDIKEGLPGVLLVLLFGKVSMTVFSRCCYLNSIKALSACFSHQEKLALSHIYVPVIYPVERKKA